MAMQCSSEENNAFQLLGRKKLWKETTWESRYRQKDNINTLVYYFFILKFLDWNLHLLLKDFKVFSPFVEAKRWNLLNVLN
jgi:hypothetical protein